MRNTIVYHRRAGLSVVELRYFLWRKLDAFCGVSTTSLVAKVRFGVRRFLDGQRCDAGLSLQPIVRSCPAIVRPMEGECKRSLALDCWSPVVTRAARRRWDGLP
jgi:hypothetical protein